MPFAKPTNKTPHAVAGLAEHERAFRVPTPSAADEPDPTGRIDVYVVCDCAEVDGPPGVLVIEVAAREIDAAGQATGRTHPPIQHSVAADVLAAGASLDEIIGVTEEQAAAQLAAVVRARAKMDARRLPRRSPRAPETP